MNYLDIDEKNIQSFNFSKTIVSNSRILGACELGKAEIQLLNSDNQYSSFKDNWIKTNFGSLYIYDVEPVQEKINIKLSCYDIKHKLDVKYDRKLFENLFPCQIVVWREAIATYYGIKFNDNNNFANADYVLDKHPYVETDASVRNVMSQIAEACASAVDTDNLDNFYFVFREDKVSNIEDWIDLTTEKESSQPVNVVVLGRGDVEDIEIYPNPEPSNPIELRIDNNYILDPQDTTSTTDRRKDVIKPIYDKVNGFKYLKFNMRTQNVEEKLNLKLGQKITYKDIYENTLEAYVMTISYNYLGGDLNDSNNYEVTLSAEDLKETNSKYSYSGKIGEKVSQIGINVDKQKEEIKLFVKKGDVINQINLDESGTKINSNNIVLEGYTTINGNFIIDLDGNLTAKKALLEDIKLNGGNITLNDDGSNQNASLKIKTGTKTQEENIRINLDLSSRQLILSFPDNLTTSLRANGMNRETGNKENIIVTPNNKIIASHYYWREGNYELGSNLEIYDEISGTTLFKRTIMSYNEDYVRPINLKYFDLSEDYGVVTSITTTDLINYIKYEEIIELETSYSGNGMYATYSDDNGNYSLESTTQLFSLIHSNNNTTSNFIINMYNQNPEDDYISFSIAGREIFRADKTGFHY